MSGQSSELDRLQLQSKVWEPAGSHLLKELGVGTGFHTLDVGCGSLGWLRLLSNWVGPRGICIGTEISESMAAAARSFCQSEELENVQIVIDNLFDSSVPKYSFDLVHARFQLAPIGRFEEQINCYSQLLAPGGLLILEDPDTASWKFTPDAPTANALIELILKAFAVGGGDFNAGKYEYELLTKAGFDPHLRAEIVALPPGHPYLQLPIQFATSLRPKLLEICNENELDNLVASAKNEISSDGRRGLSFTLVQTWARSLSLRTQ
jgi:ubiquinone/menaquinone biosynthesis C-methylase UbiE